jgi:hypothetical protein
MKSWRRAPRLLLDTLAAPGALLRSLEAAPPLGASFVLLAVLGVATQMLQARLLAPLVRLDPLAVEAPGGAAAALRNWWLLRGLACAALPLGLVVRSAALATVLQGAGALLGTAPRWRPLLGLALHLEFVFWIESGCLTLLLWLAPPASLEAVRDLELRAGLDLVWQPASPGLRALLSAGNAFTLWWAALLGCGLGRLGRLPAGAAAGVAALLWSGVVVLRLLLHPR